MRGMRRNLWILYGMVFFHSLIPAYVIERLFWADRGMRIAMVVACEMVYALVIIVMEVPSGILADRVGRKAMLLAGAALCSMEFVLLLFAHSFWLFVLAVLLTGLGGAATSGALNALLYESLLAQGREGTFGRALGRIRAIDAAAAVLAALLGSYLAGRFGLLLPYQLACISCGVAVLLCLLLVEPPRASREAGERAPSAREVLRRAGAFFRDRPDTLAFLVHATAIAAFAIYADEFWQLYLDTIAFPLLWFGAISSMMALARSVGSVLADRLSRRMGARRAALCLSAAAAAGFLVAGWQRSLLGMAALLLTVFASAAMEVIGMGYLHRRADSEARATIESIASLLERISVLLIGAVFALLAERVSIFAGFGALGILCAGVTAAFAARYRRATWDDA